MKTPKTKKAHVRVQPWPLTNPDPEKMPSLSMGAQLLALARMDGKYRALNVAETWRDALEDMLECSSDEQRRYILPVLGEVLNIIPVLIME